MDDMRQEPKSVEPVLYGGLPTPDALARGMMGDSLAENTDQYPRTHGEEWSKSDKARHKKTRAKGRGMGKQKRW